MVVSRLDLIPTPAVRPQEADASWPPPVSAVLGVRAAMLRPERPARYPIVPLRPALPVPERVSGQRRKARSLAAAAPSPAYPDTSLTTRTKAANEDHGEATPGGGMLGNGLDQLLLRLHFQSGRPVDHPAPAEVGRIVDLAA